MKKIQDVKIVISMSGFVLVITEILMLFGVLFLFQIFSNGYAARHSNEAVWVGRMDRRLRLIAMVYFSLAGIFVMLFENVSNDSIISFINVKMLFLILILMFTSVEVAAVVFGVSIISAFLIFGFSPIVLVYAIVYVIWFLAVLSVNNTELNHWLKLVSYNLFGALLWTVALWYLNGYQGYHLTSDQFMEDLLSMVILISLPYLIIYSLQKNQKVIFKQAHDAYIDGLTQVYNYHAFNLNVENAFQRSQVEGTSLSMMIIDLDKFKLINDTYGHLAGNYVLTHFCELMDEVISGDVDISAYRIGGEEFAMVFTGKTKVEALVIANQFQNIIRNESFTYHGNQINVTFSAGLTQARSRIGDQVQLNEIIAQEHVDRKASEEDVNDPYTSKTFFDDTDKLTYYSKHHGGDQITVAN